MRTTPPAGEPDDDQRWLDHQVSVLGEGVEAARAIWLNWSDLRNVGRLHPGMTAGDFIAAQLGGVRLDLPRLIADLPSMSTREIAKVAGVGRMIVSREREAVPFGTPDAEPVRVIGADGKSYPGRVVREGRRPATFGPHPLEFAARSCPGYFDGNAVARMRVSRSMAAPIQHLPIGDQLPDRALALEAHTAIGVVSGASVWGRIGGIRRRSLRTSSCMGGAQRPR